MNPLYSAEVLRFIAASPLLLHWVKTGHGDAETFSPYQPASVARCLWAPEPAGAVRPAPKNYLPSCKPSGSSPTLKVRITVLVAVSICEIVSDYRRRRRE